MDMNTLIDAVISGDTDVDSLLEDYMLLRTKDNHLPDPKRQKAARKGYREHRKTYQQAQDKWVNSAEGKSFYKRLGRRNSRKAVSGLSK